MELTGFVSWLLPFTLTSRVATLLLITILGLAILSIPWAVGMGIRDLYRLEKRDKKRLGKTRFLRKKLHRIFDQSCFPDDDAFESYCRDLRELRKFRTVPREVAVILHQLVSKWALQSHVTDQQRERLLTDAGEIVREFERLGLADTAKRNCIWNRIMLRIRQNSAGPVAPRHHRESSSFRG